MLPRWLMFLLVAICSIGDAAVIYALNTHSEFLTTMRKAGQRPVVIKFATPHCPACVVMDPVFKRLAGEYHSQMDFGEVNMQINQESHLHYHIQSVPTFIFFINGAVHHKESITDEGTLRLW